MAKLIAIVDDEPDIVELVSHNLEKAGFEVEGFFNAETFLQFIETGAPDLIVLDLMLPDMDGFEVCKQLKKRDESASIPIIMLTARGEEIDRVLGLELGADDYVTKPFSVKELVARVKVVLRRQKETPAARRIHVGESVVIDLERYEVTVAGQKLKLTPTEFRILRLLASRKGRVFTRSQVLEYLWGDEKTVVLDRTVDVHIKHLRDKLGDAGESIKNVRGIGYKLEE